MTSGEKSEETAQACLAMIEFAGHETTVDSIGSGVHQLLSRPDQWQALPADRSQLPWAVGEPLRLESPVTHASFHCATDSLPLGGQHASSRGTRCCSPSPRPIATPPASTTPTGTTSPVRARDISPQDTAFTLPRRPVGARMETRTALGAGPAARLLTAIPHATALTTADGPAHPGRARGYRPAGDPSDRLGVSAGAAVGSVSGARLRARTRLVIVVIAIAARPTKAAVV